MMSDYSMTNPSAFEEPTTGLASSLDEKGSSPNSHQKPDLSLNALLEALLFSAPSSVAPAQLAAILEISIPDVEVGLAELQERCLQGGMRLQRHQGRVQLTTAPEAAPYIERFLGLEAASRLSRAALETLAMIAYQQPVTRPEIDAVRGVNSDGVLKSLLNKGLIQETGRAERPGRPILYSTTAEFLQHFGLNSLEELPPLKDVTETPVEDSLGDLLKT